MSEIFVRIESIYDTALSHLLQTFNEDIEIVPNTINLNPEEIRPHDIHIADLDKKEGVVLKGIAPAVTAVEAIMKEHIPDCIAFHHNIHQDAIYLAEVSKYIYKKKLAILDLGGGKKGILFNAEVSAGDRFLVQIKELSTEMVKLPICSRTITLSGNYIILEVGSEFVRISRKIKGEDRIKLHELGKELAPKGFGLIMRTSALSASIEDLKFEISQQIDVWQRIVKERDEDITPRRLVSGELQSEIIFSYSSKQFLDDIRAEIEPTIPNYHIIKSYSLASSFALDFAQNFINKLPLKEMSDKLEEMIFNRDFSINNHIRGIFMYPDGMQEEISLGDLIEIEPFFVTNKVIDTNQNFPNFAIKRGDIMRVTFLPGSWTMHYHYYSPDEEPIGERLRLIFPLDIIYRGKIRAFDVGMNLFKNSEGKIYKQVDKHSTRHLIEHDMITSELDEQFVQVLDAAIQAFKDKEGQIIIQIENEE